MAHHAYNLSLEDGDKYQTLRLNLLGRGMKPEQYRAKCSLPADYPIAAQGYSDRRSAMAISLGFGRKSLKSVEALAKPKCPRATAKPHPIVKSVTEITDAQVPAGLLVSGQTDDSTAGPIAEPMDAFQETA